MAIESPITQNDEWFVGEDKTFIYYITTGAPIIMDAGASQGDTELIVKPIIEDLVTGDVIRFDNRLVTLTADCQAGDIRLPVSALTGSIQRSAVGRKRQDITGWELQLAVRLSAAGSAVLTKSGVISSAVNGVVEFSISRAETLNLTPKVYKYTLRRTNDGSNTVIAYGDATLRRAA